MGEAPAAAVPVNQENLRVLDILEAAKAETESLVRYPEICNGTAAAVPEPTTKARMQLIQVKAVAAKVNGRPVAQNHIWMELLTQAAVAQVVQTREETAVLVLLLLGFNTPFFYNISENFWSFVFGNTVVVE
jgi:hypothetical protein